MKSHQKRKIYPFVNFLLILVLMTLFGSFFIPEQKIIIPASSVHFPIEFNATQAYEDVRTQLDFGYRVPGTAEHNACADWIRGELQSVTDTVVTHNFTLPGPEDNPIYCQNVLGKLNTNKTDIIIISAHWDSRAIAEKDTINQTQPIPGANDGGSGVAVALELARVFYGNRAEFNSQIWFLFFDAEDQGSGGIANWGWAEGAEKFRDDIELFYNSTSENFSFLLLLDMVGGHDLKFIDERYSNNELQEALFKEGRDLGYLHAFPKYPDANWISDDHIPFRNLMPTLDLIINFYNPSSGWDYHHTHQDNLANIDEESLYITGSTLESFIYSYHGKTTWNENFTKWIIIGSVGGTFIIAIAVSVIFIKRKRKVEYLI
jgi:glutaminyl-peptide cyclotransferase